MLSRKYLHDYRMVEDLNERGKLCRRAEYVGETYVLIHGDGAFSAAKRCRLLLWLCAAAYIVALLPRSLAANTLYIMLPFAFSILPIMSALSRLRLLRGNPEKLRHEEADKLRSVPACAVFLMLLGAEPLLALGILSAKRSGNLLPGDAVFALGCAVLLTVGVTLFRFRKLFLCEKEK